MYSPGVAFSSNRNGPLLSSMKMRSSLDGFDRMGDLNQLSSGGFGVGTGSGEFHDSGIAIRL